MLALRFCVSMPFLLHYIRPEAFEGQQQMAAHGRALQPHYCLMSNQPQLLTLWAQPGAMAFRAQFESLSIYLYIYIYRSMNSFLALSVSILFFFVSLSLSIYLSIYFSLSLLLSLSLSLSLCYFLFCLFFSPSLLFVLSLSLTQDSIFLTHPFQARYCKNKLIRQATRGLDPVDPMAYSI